MRTQPRWKRLRVYPEDRDPGRIKGVCPVVCGILWGIGTRYHYKSVNKNPSIVTGQWAEQIRDCNNRPEAIKIKQDQFRMRMQGFKVLAKHTIKQLDDSPAESGMNSAFLL